MTVELALLFSGLSVATAIYFGIRNNKRAEKNEVKEDAMQLTTVMIKLDTIASGIAEIKAEMKNIKDDVKEDHERIIKAEESTKQAHKRLDAMEQIINTKIKN